MRWWRPANLAQLIIATCASAVYNVTYTGAADLTNEPSSVSSLFRNDSIRSIEDVSNASAYCTLSAIADNGQYSVRYIDRTRT